MEQRRVYGKSHWYHETQSRATRGDALPLVPEAAHVDDRFLLDLALPDDLLNACDSWLQPARALSRRLFPDMVQVSRLHTFSAYDRLSTALTVAQVYGVQRLCNHYAARLAPLPGPDSSRESNRRLAQITQYARQLASSPSVISSTSRGQLDEVGLTTPDIILINQIIGFVGFQARALAVFQASLGHPVRWLPGMPMQEDAPAERFAVTTTRWSSDLPAVTLSYASAAQLAALERWQLQPDLTALAPLLVTDPDVLSLLGETLTALSHPTAPHLLVALLAARINGSQHGFLALAERWQGASGLPDAVRNGERALQAWGHNHPFERAVIQAAQLLTRAPDRFSAAQLIPLQEQGFSAADAVALLAWCGLSGWLNRLNIALGNE
ncbi:CMD domain-containing protein [Trabulsiella odontotermitis]|uniref:carboxymuconolactone decarboxylase family protein n=1 Tax=Trabulsiella odontotermitis TaxID=379893 RepID=UPI003AD7198F